MLMLVKRCISPLGIFSYPEEGVDVAGQEPHDTDMELFQDGRFFIILQREPKCKRHLCVQQRASLCADLLKENFNVPRLKPLYHYQTPLFCNPQTMVHEDGETYYYQAMVNCDLRNVNMKSNVNGS